jgi:hypothetical protein
VRTKWGIGEHLTLGGGVKVDWWDEAHRSGGVVAGVPRYPDYVTKKLMVWVEGKYEIKEGAFFSYRVELLEKDLDASDDALDRKYRHVVRSLAMLYAGF